jgi:hypothetical protein
VSKTQGSIARIYLLKAPRQHAHSVGLLRRTTILLGAFVCAFAAAPAASAADIPACTGSPPTAPCVASLKKNGTPIPYTNVLETGSEVSSGQTYLSGGARYFDFSIQDEHGDYALDLDDSYEVVLDTGTVYPGEVLSAGREVVVTRSVGGSSGHNIVRISMRPVRVADHGCTNTGVCGLAAGRVLTGYWRAVVDNLAYLDSAADRAAMRGYDFSTNAEWSSSPPLLDFDGHTIRVDVANAHWEDAAHTTPFVGRAELKFPFPMLRRLYDVDDPGSLTPGAFTITGAGAATTSLVVDAGGHTVRVAIENLTFSKRRLRIHGDTRPARPHDVVARRQTSTRGRITFSPATPRGSLIRGYKATCRYSSPTLRHHAWVTGAGSPLIVRNLRPGLRYSCNVRALSRAGIGRIARVTMPRFPA